MPVFVYVLSSLKSQVLYTGMTENLERRLLEHNQGKTKFTKGHLPWELIYKEETPDFAEGRKREKFLKSAAGKRFLQKWFDQEGHVPFTDETQGSLPD
jgi:predicted GIY-YIG superfamily endonuclease